jgi:hypothetical protein
MGVHLSGDRGEEAAPREDAAFDVPKHAARAGIPATDIFAVVDTLVAGPDPVAVAA